MQQDISIGQQIGEFIIQERIGTGSTSNVYRAYQPSMGRDVALKIVRLNDKQQQDTDLHAQFIREVKRIAALKHTHILAIYDYGIHERFAYIAIRLIGGNTLYDVHNKQTKVDVNEAVHYITQITRGVAFAHARGVVHHDLKPSSIFVDDDSNAFVSDFGIGREIVDSDTLTSRVGTQSLPFYAAPEEIRGDAVDLRTNVYNLGAILYYLTTGQPPYADLKGSPIEQTERMLNYLPTRPQQINPDLPATLEDVIFKAMSKNPANRYENADDFLVGVNQAVGGLYEALPIQNITERAEEQMRANLSAIEAMEESLTPLNRSINTAVGILTAAIIIVSLGYFLWSAPVQQPTIVSNATILADEIEITDALMSNAQRHVRNEGFVAYLICNGLIPAEVERSETFGALLEPNGIEVRVYDSLGNVDREKQMVDIAIRSGASIVVPCLLPGSQAIPALQAAERENVHVVLANDVYMDDFAEPVVVLGDDYSLGYLIGLSAGNDLIERSVPDGVTIILDYPAERNTPERAQGIEDGLANIAPEARLLGRYVGDERETAYEAVSGLLSRGATLNLIISVTDMGAYGAVDALRDEAVSPLFTSVFSIGGDELAYQYINAGLYMRGIVESNDDAQIQALANAVIVLLGGGTIEQRINIEPGGIYTGELVIP